jgi:hypothetical protein
MDEEVRSILLGTAGLSLAGVIALIYDPVLSRNLTKYPIGANLQVPDAVCGFAGSACRRRTAPA